MRGDLKPCPFCGNNHQGSLDVKPLDDPPQQRWTVMCGWCLTEGPQRGSPEEAMVRWNERKTTLEFYR